MSAIRRLYPAVYPRVGGGNRGRLVSALQSGGLSPRGRGKLLLIMQHIYLSGSIPAWAGETFRPGARLDCLQVYPRVGGGNRSKGKATALCWGLSPRGRGKQLYEV